MTRAEFLQELKKLTSTECLAVAEAAFTLVREELQQIAQPSSPAEMKQRLAKAAEVLLSDYQAGGNLIAFAVLDSEDFCEKR